MSLGRLSVLTASDSSLSLPVWVSTIAAPEESMENPTWTLKMLLKFQRSKQITSAIPVSKGQECEFLPCTQKEKGWRNIGEH